MITVGIVVLNFRTYFDTKCFLSSIYNLSKRESLNVYVVDNDSNASQLEELKEECAHFNFNIKYLSSSNNLGFANGMNIGIKSARSDGCDYIICANSDIVLPQDFSFYKLIEPALKNLNIGMVGPLIKNLDGANQNPLYVEDPFPSTLKIKFLKAFFLTPILGKWLFFNKSKFTLFFKLFNVRADKKMQKTSSDNICTLHGSFFALTPKYFDFYDGLDSNTFLYVEELILSKRLKAHGMIPLLNRDLTVVHKEDSATNSLFHSESDKNKFILTENYKSLCYFFREYI